MKMAFYKPSGRKVKETGKRRNVKENSISINIVIEKIRFLKIKFVFFFVKLNEWNIEGGLPT